MITQPMGKVDEINAVIRALENETPPTEIPQIIVDQLLSMPAEQSKSAMAFVNYIRR